MEVHHHPHAEKISFKEYLLEGLMIFLAVSMGFIAENIREKISEHEIEKRNMEIIIDNLKEDTVTLAKVIKLNLLRMQLLDSLVTFQGKNLADTNNGKVFSRLFLKSSNIPLFKSNNAAFEQMKNSGSLRLVKRKMILDSLFEYSKLSQRIDFNTEILIENSKLIVEDAANFISFNRIINGSANIEYTPNERDVFRFYNHCVSLKFRLAAGLTAEWNQQFENASRLIQLLRTEYNIH